MLRSNQSCDQAWSRLKNLLKSKSKFIESKFSELKSKSVFIESVFYGFVFDFGTTSVYRKITIRYISIQNSTGVISINIELYRFYSVISKWHRFQLLLKNREYFPSVISVSDRFLFKKRFYFDICIGLISIYYRHRCQTGYKAMEEQKSSLKMAIFIDEN